MNRAAPSVWCEGPGGAAKFNPATPGKVALQHGAPRPKALQQIHFFDKVRTYHGPCE
jgi:hypothetical protein